MLPVGNSSFFWGFFVVAGLLFLLGGLAGYLAAKFFKESTPPVPEMAIDEAGKIKRTLMFAQEEAALDARAHARADPRVDRGQPPRARHVDRAPARTRSRC